MPLCDTDNYIFSTSRALVKEHAAEQKTSRTRKCAACLLLQRLAYAAGGDSFMDKVEAWAKSFKGSWTSMITELENSILSWEKTNNG